MHRIPILAALICLGGCAGRTAVQGDSVRTTTTAQAEADHEIPPAPDHPLLNRFKSLAGTWIEKDGDGNPTGKEAHYRVTAGGGAVIETLFPGSPHEMITVYHLDGDVLMLTHYCVLQNQPRMRATHWQEDRMIHFTFADATSMTSVNESHMHEVVFNFIDANRFQATWTNFKDGESVHEAAVEMVREGA